MKARLPFLSGSALGALLSIAKNEQLPDLSGRHVVRKARDLYVSATTPFGTLHQSLDLGGGISIEVQHLMAMLYVVVSKSEAFCALMARALAQFPCSPATPWQLIIHIDGVSPGNQLAYAHERKTWAWYWSFMEFEQSLSSEDIAAAMSAAIYTCVSLQRPCLTQTHARMQRPHAHTHTHIYKRMRTHTRTHARAHSSGRLVRSHCGQELTDVTNSWRCVRRVQ